MTRQSIMKRFEILEEHFGKKLRKELQKVADGTISRYLDRKIPHWADGKVHRDDIAAVMERNERELRTLSEKTALASKAIKLLDAYIAQVSLDTRKVLARELLGS